MTFKATPLPSRQKAAQSFLEHQLADCNLFLQTLTEKIASKIASAVTTSRYPKVEFVMSVEHFQAPNYRVYDPELNDRLGRALRVWLEAWLQDDYRRVEMELVPQLQGGYVDVSLSVELY
jgi:hypothetical protein